MTTPAHLPACAVDPGLHPLAQLRAARGWSYQRLARIIAAQARRQGHNMAAERQKVWRWEHKGVTPDRMTQALLADVLGVAPEHVAAHPWPAWLPSAEPPPCAQAIADLRKQLAEAQEQIAVLRRQAGRRAVCRASGRRRIR